MKNKRFQHAFRSNASKLHKKVGNRLLNSPVFTNYSIFQEYPVNLINKKFHSGRHKFDWVILELKVVIEVMGEFHTQLIDISGDLTKEEMERNLQHRQELDKIKMDAAIEAGWTYITIPYTDTKLVNSDYIYNKIKESSNNYITPEKEAKPIDEYKEKQKEKARQYRKLQYSKRKEWLKKNKECENE